MTPRCDLCDLLIDTEGQTTLEGCICSDCLDSIRIVDQLAADLDEAMPDHSTGLKV